jgi:peptidoglycan/xylan/chitin deacetylase (PgdA/CDA1 family)
MNTKIIKFLIKLGGLQLAKLLTKKTPRIFMYHSFSDEQVDGAVSAKEFEWQVEKIKNNFNPISLLELSNLVTFNKPIPNNTIVITIDDGYKNFYDIAFPILKKHNVPATFFVTTGFINGDLWLWPDQLKWLLQKNTTRLDSVNLNNHDFLLNGTFAENWQTINDYCLSIADELKYRCIKELANHLKVELPIKAPERYSPCTWPQLTEMQNAGIEIGGHTVTHPSLGQVSITQAKVEIENCYNELNNKLGEQQRTFCYPNGAPNDYNEAIKDIVKDAGFVNAVTAFNDLYNLSLPFAWRRFDGGNNKFDFKKSLYGIEHIGNRIRKLKRCHY